MNTLFDVALDHLWRNMFNLIPFLNFDHSCQFNINGIFNGRVACWIGRVIGPTTSDTSRLISGEIEWSSNAYLMQPVCIRINVSVSDLSRRIVLCKPESTLIMTSQEIPAANCISMKPLMGISLVGIFLFDQICNRCRPADDRHIII